MQSHREKFTTPAHNVLRPVFEWFAEGHDTKDLRQASLLLRQLSA